MWITRGVDVNLKRCPLELLCSHRSCKGVVDLIDQLFVSLAHVVYSCNASFIGDTKASAISMDGST